LQVDSCQALSASTISATASVPPTPSTQPTLSVERVNVSPVGFAIREQPTAVCKPHYSHRICIRSLGVGKVHHHSPSESTDHCSCFKCRRSVFAFTRRITIKRCSRVDTAHAKHTVTAQRTMNGCTTIKSRVTHACRSVNGGRDDLGFDMAQLAGPHLAKAVATVAFSKRQPGHTARPYIVSHRCSTVSLMRDCFARRWIPRSSRDLSNNVWVHPPQPFEKVTTVADVQPVPTECPPNRHQVSG
jgi:hypothetical protein